jgi:hypothetical protein
LGGFGYNGVTFPSSRMLEEVEIFFVGGHHDPS